MESETVLYSADFCCDDPFLRRGEIFSDITFYPYPGGLFTYIEKYCKIKKILIVYTITCIHVYNIEVII